MGTTPRYGLAYLDPGQSLVDTRDVLEDNADTTEAALARIAGYVDQLVSLLPTAGTATHIGLDVDGQPYYDPAGAITQPAGIGLDTDLVPYVVAFTPRSTL